MFKRIRKVSHFDSNRKFRVILEHFHGFLKENSTPKFNFTHQYKKLELMSIISGLTKKKNLKNPYFKKFAAAAVFMDLGLRGVHVEANLLNGRREAKQKCMSDKRQNNH